ncbi:MAG: hypothetical protein K8I03_11855 [Ignavibacteria bacterium]|nr:hypothetical protein [Ignavibacteria bacterium]
MTKILIIFLFIISFSVIYAQTEQDNFEKLRIERIEKKVKVMKSDNNIKDYFDKQGFHIKREYYDNNNNISSHSFIKHLDNGDLSVEMDLGPEGKFTTTGSQALYYVTYFDPYNLIDNVVMTFDAKSRLIEERISGNDGEINEIEKYFYDNDEDKFNRSETYSDNKLVGKTIYYYNELRLLIKIEYLWLYNNEMTITNYSYEFY